MARPGTFQKGNKLGQGRPKAEKSLTRALREKADPDELAAFLLDTFRDSGTPISLRVAIAEKIYDRVDGTPIQQIRTDSADLPQLIIVGPDFKLPDGENE